MAEREDDTFDVGCALGRVRYRQHPETGMVQRMHEDGSHHTPSLGSRCSEEMTSPAP